MGKKNATIELYRFIFTVSIAVMHFYEAFSSAKNNITIGPIFLQRGGILVLIFSLCSAAS